MGKKITIPGGKSQQISKRCIMTHELICFKDIDYAAYFPKNIFPKLLTTLWILSEISMNSLYYAQSDICGNTLLRVMRLFQQATTCLITPPPPPCLLSLVLSKRGCPALLFSASVPEQRNVQVEQTQWSAVQTEEDRSKWWMMGVVQPANKQVEGNQRNLASLREWDR